MSAPVEWADDADVAELTGQEILPITDDEEDDGPTDALTWDDLADAYKKHTGHTARIKPMDEVFDWAVGRTDLFEVDSEGYIYSKKGA